MGKLGRRRRRRNLTEAERKLAKFRQAKTLLGRANYLIDFADEVSPNPVRDEVAHLAAEVLLGRGPATNRIIRWGRKFVKYRLSNFSIGDGGVVRRPQEPRRPPKPLTGRSIGLRPVRQKTKGRRRRKALTGKAFGLVPNDPVASRPSEGDQSHN